MHMYRKAHTMKNIIACLILLASSICANSQSFNPHNFTDTIQLIESDTVFYARLQGNVNGKEVRFIFDTGCTTNFIFSSFAPDDQKEFSVKIHDSNKQKVDGEGLLLDWTIGKQHYKDDIFFSRDVDTTTEAGKTLSLLFDGLIGQNYFHYPQDHMKAVKIDLRNHILVTTTDKHLFDSEKGFEAKYKWKHGKRNELLFFDIELFPGCTLNNVVWDSGSHRLLEISPMDYYNIKKSSKSKELASITSSAEKTKGRVGIAGRSDSISVISLTPEKLRIGDIVIAPKHSITVKNGPGDTSLGAFLFRYGTVIINPWKKKIIFQPYED